MRSAVQAVFMCLVCYAPLPIVLLQQEKLKLLCMLEFMKSWRGFQQGEEKGTKSILCHYYC